MDIRKPPYLTMLSSEDRSKFYSAALDVLAQTGINVLEESILKTLADAGAKIEGTRAYIPAKLVEQALTTAPKEIQIYNRDGAPAMHLSGYNNYYGNGTDCPNILDPFTGQRRPFLKKDIEQAGILCDAISNYSFVMPTGVASDVPSPIADIHNFHAMLSNTAKPIIFTAYTPENHQDIYRIASIAAGGEKALQDKPFIISYPQPISPLTFTKEVCEKLRFCVEHRIPVICTTAPIAGGSGPVTAEATMVLDLAECLGAIVIGQTINPGAPMITVGIPIILNMKTAAISFDAPELQLMSTGLFDLREYFQMPIWGMAAATDSKLPDEQAAITAAISCTFQSLGGANLIHGIGCLESGMTTSFELILMTSEIIGMLKRILGGVNSDSDHMAKGVIQEVGPGGEYLTNEHTLTYFYELWDSELVDRTSYETWVKNGSKTFCQRINDKVKYIIQTHQPNRMSAEKSQAIDELIRFRESKL